VKKKLREKNTRGSDSKRSRPRVFSLGSTLNQPPSVITLLTDFGTADYFIAAVKGVILSSNPNARIVDITHEIPPQDIEAAAFTLLAAYSSFPPGTIHVAVVDPGVGSARRPILIKVAEQFFIGPDNGIFSYVWDSCEHQGLSATIFHLTNAEYFRHPVSPTFHGRDVFAAVAVALSLGSKPKDMGTSISEIVGLQPLRPFSSPDGRIKGRIIHIDRFGNCITNITDEDLTAEMIAAGAKLTVKGKSVKTFRQYFAEESISHEKLFGIWGSAGFLEIAATNDSAARLLKARRGDAVIIR
jgi:S-adenosylmethionine hydrolase